jgi:hypothetical protein
MSMRRSSAMMYVVTPDTICISTFGVQDANESNVQIAMADVTEFNDETWGTMLCWPDFGGTPLANAEDHFNCDVLPQALF